MDIDGTTWAAQSAAIQRGLDLAGLHGLSVVSVSAGAPDDYPLVHAANYDERTVADVLREIGGVWRAGDGPTAIRLTTQHAGCTVLMLDDGSCRAFYGASSAQVFHDWTVAA